MRAELIRDKQRSRRGITGLNRTTGIAAVALAIGAFLLSPGRALAVQAILTDDSYISSSQPSTNFGASGNLNISSSERTFLRFAFPTQAWHSLPFTK